jgi:hypothetical protein
MSNDKQILYDRKTIVNIEGHQLPAMFSEATTLRDQFAMAALTGIASRDGMSSADYMSRLAYELADAMLETRK